MAQTLIQMAEMIAGPALTDLQRAFFNAAQQGSTASAEDARVRLWQDEVSVTLLPFNVADRAGVLLQDIHALNPGHGFGGKALDWLCGLADTHRQFIELLPERQDTDGGKITDDAGLQDWYRRRGFRDSGLTMRRMPQPL